MTAQTDTGSEQDSGHWYLLMDPHWTPAEEDEPPPIEAVAGAWPVEEDDEVGVFQPNPDYQPVDETLPTDPVDALLRELAEGDAEPEHVRALLRQSLVFQAMNGDGRPLVIPAPDDAPCVVVATAAPHVARVFAPAWRRVDYAGFVDELPDGIDVLLNPEGPAAARLTGTFVREDAEADERFLAEYEPGDDSKLYVMPWNAGAPGPDAARS
ncbi:type VII secretion system-associated protein [Amycolatopsis minnesotensis]|uniref:Type III secretion system (T3SS) SseB-like protein n=1 Tax=Amycolatopsis minnesotensis TaxID=337894 RepID=A0ABP5E4C1_9PSEU